MTCLRRLLNRLLLHGLDSRSTSAVGRSSALVHTHLSAVSVKSLPVYHAFHTLSPHVSSAPPPEPLAGLANTTETVPHGLRHGGSPTSTRASLRT